jgi:NDP-sugar pyrophosphorylase family protein
MKAVILAGGLGTRLQPFTQVVPKPLLPMGEQSLMEVQLQALRAHGFTQIYVATNYKSEYIESFLGNGSRYDVELHFSREQEPLGSCGPIGLLRAQLDEPFLVMNGDVLTKLNLRAFYDFAVAQDTLLTVGTKIITTPFRFGNVKVDASDHIVDIDEKPDLKMEILAGIYCMKPELLAHIPDNQYFGMDTLLKNLLAARVPVSRYLIQEYWIDIGQVEDYSKAREAYAKDFQS